MNTSRVVLICLIAGFLASCDSSSPTENVDPTILNPEFAVTMNEKDLPFSFTVPNFCGEAVVLEGLEHWVEKETVTPSGRVLWQFHSNSKGTATGQTSGNVWKFSSQWGDQYTYDSNDDEPWVRNYIDTVVLIGQGVPSIPSQWHYHITVNANGDLVVKRWWGHRMCPA